jgi:preprotein translocase subunit Sec61beta
MADKNRVSMPASTAGLTRFFDEYHSKLVLKPAYVLALAIITIVVVLLLNLYGSSLLGL